jgi:hypothetical protein
MNTEHSLLNRVHDEDEITVERVSLIPARILGFVKDSDDQLFAIIHSCHENPKKESVLTRRWRLEFEDDKNPLGDHICPTDVSLDDTSTKSPLIRKVLVDCMERHCLMLPYHAKSHFLLELIPQDKWPDEFSEV